MATKKDQQEEERLLDELDDQNIRMEKKEQEILYFREKNSVKIEEMLKLKTKSKTL